MRLSVSSRVRMAVTDCERNWHSRSVRSGCLLMGVLALPVTGGAQAVTGTLLGNVTDASGGAVPGATVTAVETQTNISRTAVSNEAGNYIFSSLRNGTYSVKAELHGLPQGHAPERPRRRQHDDARRPDARARIR